MPTKQNAEPEQAAEFDLKHRVTGAAVLLLFGVLVLPWLLGPPTEASKVDLSTTSPKISDIEAVNIIVDSRDKEAMDIAGDVEETVYISKITPLDAKGNRELVQAANQAAASTQIQIKAAQESSEKENAEALAELVSEQKEAIERSVNGDAATIRDDSKDNKQQVVKPQLEKDSNKIDQELATREKELQAALAAEIKAREVKPNPIDVGWVVQVGLFTEKNRAIALISELKKRGFSASSSVVDTNRGKNTGTRVWLGPFTKRVSAINEQKRLKSKAGKEGFIRVYP